MSRAFPLLPFWPMFGFRWLLMIWSKASSGLTSTKSGQLLDGNVQVLELKTKNSRCVVKCYRVDSPRQRKHFHDLGRISTRRGSSAHDHSGTGRKTYFLSRIYCTNDTGMCQLHEFYTSTHNTYSSGTLTKSTGRTYTGSLPSVEPTSWS